MIAPRISASAKLATKLMIAVAITLAAASFLIGHPTSNAAVRADNTAQSHGSVVVRMSPFEPENLDQTAFNDAG